MTRLQYDTFLRRHADLVVAAVLIVTANVSLVWGQPSVCLMFTPGAVARGELWRLVTHAFVHLSFYHLLMDGVAFFVLLWALRTRTLRQRMGVVGVCAAGSLAGACLSSNPVLHNGFCGLSGIAHGLMAVVALELLKADDDRTVRAVGGVTLGLVVLKSVLEVYADGFLFGGLHIGDVGVPITACHLGGVVAGRAAVLAARVYLRAPSTSFSSENS